MAATSRSTVVALKFWLSDRLSLQATAGSDPQETVAVFLAMPAMHRLRPFVGDSFRVANFLSELNSFLALGMAAKRCSPISPRFSIVRLQPSHLYSSVEAMQSSNFFEGVRDGETGSGILARATGGVASK